MFCHKLFLISCSLMRLTILCTIVVFPVGRAVHAADNGLSALTREQRVVEMAHQAVVMQLLVLRNPTSKSLCEKDRYACLGPNSTELGLSIMGELPGKAAENGLMSVLRYRIDAGLSQDYTCYMLQRGKTLVPKLSTLNYSAVQMACREEISDQIRKHSPLFDQIQVEKICATEQEIKHRVESLLDALGRGARCNPQDF